jgi:hypothetical protein
MRWRKGTLALIVALALLGSSPAAAAGGAYFFGFERGLRGWERDHQIDCEQDPEPCTFNWRIVRSTEQAKGGTTSLKATLDGTNDDGTIWLERQFDIRGRTTVEVSFWLWSETEADINTWPVVAYIGRQNPEHETDFTIVGQTDRKAGWSRYTLTRTVSGRNVWVAFGFGATWESERTYFLDSVRVTT